MAQKSRATFEKRQKERARQEKQRDKQARRFAAAKERKAGTAPLAEGEEAIPDDEPAPPAPAEE